LLITRCMLADDPQPDETVVKEVLNYFLRNAQAADSLEGIARWRLLDEVVRRKVEETRWALEWLVQRKFLRKTKVAGGEPVFSLNQKKIPEAKSFLAAADLVTREKKD
jgi:hypothetical protein